MTLDLKTEAGRQVFYRMAKKADVITQNFRVGVVEKLGVDYETVRRHNPGSFTLPPRAWSPGASRKGRGDGHSGPGPERVYVAQCGLRG